jgi:hypothetical protein
LANIDAFLEFADQSSDPKPPRRASLRWVMARRGVFSDASRRERVLAALAVVAIEIATVFFLRGAMRTVHDRSRGADVPLIVTFITRPRNETVEAAAARPPTATAKLKPVMTILAPRLVRRDDALRAVIVPPPPTQVHATPADQPSTVHLYNPDGELVLPSAPFTPPPRDLLAHRDASYMIPGAARSDSPDFHVRPGLAPRDVVNRAGRILSGLIGNAGKGVADSTGQPVPVADRGVRTSGRDSDPCEDLAIDRLDLDDPDRAEQADERYAQFCQGH